MSPRLGRSSVLLLVLLSTAVSVTGLQKNAIPPGSKVYVEHLGGFEKDLTVAIIASAVPLVVVNDRNAADVEISARHRQRSRGSFGAEKTIEEATITVSGVRDGIVLDAFTLTADSVERLASICAGRLRDVLSAPPRPSAVSPVSAPTNLRPPAPAQTPAVAAAAPATDARSVIRLLVQGDFDRLSDFIEALREQLRIAGVVAQMVRRGEPYQYNVVFSRSDTNAAAVVLDAQGILVVSVLDSGFRVKGVTEGCAKKLAKQLAALNQK